MVRASSLTIQLYTGRVIFDPEVLKACKKVETDSKASKKTERKVEEKDFQNVYLFSVTSNGMITVGNNAPQFWSG